LDEIILDGVTRPQHLSVFKAGKRVDKSFLRFDRQTHREAVHVNLFDVQAFRLEEQLMAFSLRKPHHLIFERWAIPRANAFDLAVEERRLMDARSDQFVDAVVGVKQVTHDPVRRYFGCGKRECNRIRITLFHVEHASVYTCIEIDRSPRQSWRRSGLQAPPTDAQAFDRLSEIAGRRLIGAAGGTLLWADMDETVEKGAGRHNQCPAAINTAIFERQAADLGAVEKDSSSAADDPLDIWLGFERGANPSPVARFVSLGARRPYRRTAAAIEQFELDAGRVDGPTHQPTQRINFSD
jgi:hypothetical protein